MSHRNAVEMRLVLEALPAAERHLVEHLLGCPPCRAALDRELGRMPPDEDTKYDRALGRALERAAAATSEAEPRVAEERAAARRQLDDLWTLRPDHWPAFFLGPLSPAFLLLVLETAARAVRQDPNKAETLAKHVHDAAERLRAELPEVLHAELRCRARALAGRARALRGEWATADAAFEQASVGFTAFPNLLAEAELCRLEAAGFAARNRLTEASALLGRAASLAGAAGQVHEEIADLGELAQLCHAGGDLDQAAGLLARALLRADDAGLDVSAAQLRFRLTWTLRRLGELQSALRLTPPAVRSAWGADASELIVSAFVHLCRGEDAAAGTKLKSAAYGALLFNGDVLLAAVASLTLLSLHVLEGNGEKLRDLAVAIGVLGEPSELAAETRAAFAALATALRDQTGSIGALLLAAAAAVDRHESPSSKEDGVPEDVN
jgi:tetratricopeptide (TPR) repeat protein